MAVWAGACLHPLATCVAKLTWVRSEGFNQGKVVSELKCSLAHGCMTLHVPVPTEYVRPRIGMKRKLGMQSLVYTRFSLWLEGLSKLSLARSAQEVESFTNHLKVWMLYACTGIAKYKDVPTCSQWGKCLN